MHRHGLCRHAVSLCVCMCVYSHLVCDPTIRQPGFDLPLQQWSLLNCFHTEQGHCGACRRKWRLTDCVLVARPRRCLTLSNPVPWQNWMAAYLGYTLRMKTLFRGRPVMVHDTHTTRRRRLTDTKHLATSLREQSYLFQSVNLPRLSEWRGRSFCHAVCLNRIIHECVNGRRPNVVGMGKEWLSRSD